MFAFLQSFEPVRQPENTYGKFYNGDAYIVLNVSDTAEQSLRFTHYHACFVETCIQMQSPIHHVGIPGTLSFAAVGPLMFFTDLKINKVLVVFRSYCNYASYVKIIDIKSTNTNRRIFISTYRNVLQMYWSRRILIARE